MLQSPEALSRVASRMHSVADSVGAMLASAGVGDLGPAGSALVASGRMLTQVRTRPDP